jgi:hypothetical protein
MKANGTISQIDCSPVTVGKSGKHPRLRVVSLYKKLHHAASLFECTITEFRLLENTKRSYWPNTVAEFADCPTLAKDRANDSPTEFSDPPETETGLRKVTAKIGTKASSVTIDGGTLSATPVLILGASASTAIEEIGTAIAAPVITLGANALIVTCETGTNTAAPMLILGAKPSNAIKFAGIATAAPMLADGASAPISIAEAGTSIVTSTANAPKLSPQARPQD